MSDNPSWLQLCETVEELGAGVTDCDGVEWPTAQAMETARRIMPSLGGVTVVPGGDGGIVFAERNGMFRVEAEVDAAGDVQMLTFLCGELFHTQAVDKATLEEYFRDADRS